jgi:hypothetical protein
MGVLLSALAMRRSLVSAAKVRGAFVARCFAHTHSVTSCRVTALVRTQIGFVGLGNMGRHMAANLLKAGHSVVVYDGAQSTVDPAFVCAYCFRPSRDVLGWLCCSVLCCAVLCCAVLCCAVLCCAVLCCAVLCCRRAVVGDAVKQLEAQGATAAKSPSEVAAQVRMWRWLVVLRIDCCLSMRWR